MTRRLLRALRVLATFLVAAGLGVAGYWLGTRTVRTAPTKPAAALTATVVARNGTLVDERPATVSAEWAKSSTVLNRLPGTVTATHISAVQPTTISAGEVLFVIDQTPVVAMAGAVPAFREMTPDLAGADIAQLQEYLIAAGYSISNPDGRWRYSTTVAYNQWRKDMSLPPRETIVLGEVQFFATLPVVVTATEKLTVGGVVGDTDVVFNGLATVPSLTLSVGIEASQQFPVGTLISVDVNGTTVDAVTTTREALAPAGSGRLVQLDLSETAKVCQVWCDRVPTASASSWPATVRVKGPATGIIVPVGAVQSGAGSAKIVKLKSGDSRSVQVVLQVGGDAVVTGVQAGDVIELPTPPPASSAKTP